MPEPAPGDPLDVLRERLERTQDAVKRLADETAAGARERVPPRGWAAPGPDREGPGELAALVALLDSARGLVPRELQQQFAELVRELLLLVRALIDFYLDRAGRARPGDAQVEVEDIPID
jgi:hypothetical protein